MLILDFDGTLFNTLPAHFKIKKRGITDIEGQIACHLDYIERQKCSLQAYADEWKIFFQSLGKREIYILSESPPEIPLLYLEAFSLDRYFSGVFGHQFAKDGTRAKKLKELAGEPGWLISDNRSDQELNFLKVINAQAFHAGGFALFQEKILNLRKTICEM